MKQETKDKLKKALKVGGAIAAGTGGLVLGAKGMEHASNYLADKEYDREYHPHQDHVLNKILPDNMTPKSLHRYEHNTPKKRMIAAGIGATAGIIGANKLLKKKK